MCKAQPQPFLACVRIGDNLPALKSYIIFRLLFMELWDHISVWAGAATGLPPSTVYSISDAGRA